MADPKGFLTTDRAVPTRRPVDVRIKDWKEVYEELFLICRSKLVVAWIAEFRSAIQVAHLVI